MIDALIAHLQTSLPEFTVTHAQDQKPVDDALENLPLIGIFPGDDMAGDDGTDRRPSQQVTSTILVHLVCDIEDLDTNRAALRAAAVGWSAAPGYDDLLLRSGKILQLKGGVIWWEDTYSHWFTLRP